MKGFLILVFVFTTWETLGQTQTMLLYKCENYYLAGQQDSVRKYAKVALDFVQKNSENHSSFQYYLANSNMRSYPDSSFKVLSAVYKDFQKRSDTKFLSFIHTSFGGYYRKIGNFKEAIANYQKAITFAEKHFGTSDQKKLNQIVAAQYNSIAIVNFEMSDYELSTQNALKALKMANQYNLPQIELASSIILGNIQMHFKQLDQAEKSFFSAKNLSSKINDQYRHGVALANLGIINLLRVENSAQNKKAYSASKKYFLEALNMAKTQKDYTAITARYSNLANVENAVKNFKGANAYLQEALKNAELSNSKLLKMQVTTSLARNHLELNDTPKAIELANIALEMSKQLSNEKELPNLYNILQEAYTKEKDFAKALEYQKAQMAAKDSLYTTNTTAKITELQTKYETEKKQKEIEVLTLQNKTKEAQLKQKNYLILAAALGIFSLLGGFYFWNKQRKLKNVKEAAEMKQRLLRAQLNPHFLFNSLNSIQRLYVEGKTHIANDFIADFAQLMRDILEKTGRTLIPVYEEMDFIEAYLSLEKRRLGDKFDYEILLSDEVRNGDYNIPSFIVQPLVENALLHGILPKNERGKIEVKVETLSNVSLEISVKDNGVGYYSGKKNPNHKSKAMELIKNRLGKSGAIQIKELKDTNGQVDGTEIKLILEY
ncbi:MAG: histidine kinase [Cytophagaceae bacterium]|nr:histidine kinase [Cytophagaceae bacterium]